jgi:hypothetical protein
LTCRPTDTSQDLLSVFIGFVLNPKAAKRTKVEQSSM